MMGVCAADLLLQPHVRAPELGGAAADFDDRLHQGLVGPAGAQRLRDGGAGALPGRRQGLAGSGPNDLRARRGEAR